MVGNQGSQGLPGLKESEEVAKMFSDDVEDTEEFATREGRLSTQGGSSGSDQIRKHTEP